MPVVSLRTRNQSQSGWRSTSGVIPDSPQGRSGTHVSQHFDFNHQSSWIDGSRLSLREAGMTALRSSRPPLLRILLVHLLEERRRRDIPLFLELDQLAGAVPVLELLGHELAPWSIALRQRHRETPRLLQNRRQRHLKARPFRIGEA